MLSLVLICAPLAPLAPLQANPHHDGSHSSGGSHSGNHHSGGHPDHWKRDPNRWKGNNWDRNTRHDHWNRPCGGLGCDPHTWGPNRLRPDWHQHRPWHHGWYGPGYVDRWGWWGPRAAAWGIGSLATAAVINSAMSSAIAANQPMIVVPGSTYQLLYGSIQVPSENVATFVVKRDGFSYQMDADCADGELNGHAPNSAAEAQLLNTACQVAFGGR